MSTAPDVFLTREEMAALFRVDPQTISHWVRKQRLPAPLRLGRQMLWRRQALERFLARQEESARA
jgi:excisionase family DNA binding protein